MASIEVTHYDKGFIINDTQIIPDFKRNICQ